MTGFYRPIPPRVEARQWANEDTTSAILAWITETLGETMPDGQPLDEGFLTDTLAAGYGDWIVKTATGEIKAYSVADFETRFEADDV